ncbi:MAG: hypothetical protein GXP52_05590 [Deltaproteobacteria bacterium]|nr:hypothetical protein [Deltaproteobacteria bacterium]
MNTSISKSVLAGIAVAIVLLGGQWASAGPAPLYPGPAVEGEQRVVVLEGEGGNTTRIFRIFYTRDPLKKVAAYYEGKMPQKTASSATEATFDGSPGTPLEYGAVKVWRPAAVLSEFDLFDPLKEEMGKEQAGMGNGHHTQHDLKALQARYGYLADEAFFPGFSPRERLKGCRKKTGSGIGKAKQDQASLQARIQELASQGRFGEMQQLLSQAQGVTSNTNQAMSVSHWDEWTGCLDELDAGAFRTQINIRIK